MKAISSDIPPSRSAISRLTESIRKSNSWKDLVDETRKNLNSVTLSAVCELNEEFTYHLRHDTVATVRSEYEGFSYWNRLLSQFGDIKQEKDRQSLDHFNATSPCEPSEKKRARKHAHVNSPLLAINQIRERHETDWTRRPRRFSSFLRTSSKFSYPRRRRYKQRLAGRDSQTNSKLRVKTRVSAQLTGNVIYWLNSLFYYFN